MSKNLKISLALIAAVLVAVMAAALGSGDDAAESEGTRDEQLVRPDSRLLSEAEDGKVTFVEFLDFEDLLMMIDEALAA